MLENSQSSINSIFVKLNKKRFFQGDVLHDLKISLWGAGPDNEINAPEVSLPYCVVMTQDCDLDWDIKWRQENKPNQDKYLQTILVCPAYQAEIFYKGEHIIGWKMLERGSEAKKIAKNDEVNRCHYFPGDSSVQVPEMVIDFKHFYTIPRDFLYSQYDDLYLATVNELFRERLSQRFANYLSRFGLPEFKTDSIDALLA